MVFVFVKVLHSTGVTSRTNVILMYDVAYHMEPSRDFDGIVEIRRFRTMKRGQGTTARYTKDEVYAVDFTIKSEASNFKVKQEGWTFVKDGDMAPFQVSFL